MKLESQFHSWWKFINRTPITDGYGVKVKKALQGHPESPWLWAKLIDRIIVKLVFQSCKHKPCLYCHPEFKDNSIYLIRKVDDFVIGCKDKKITEEIIDIIDEHMTINIKHLGGITRFNGVDVTQTQQYQDQQCNIY